MNLINKSNNQIIIQDSLFLTKWNFKPFNNFYLFMIKEEIITL